VALVGGVSLPANASTGWSSWRSCVFTVAGDGLPSHWTPVRWYLYDPGGNRRVQTVQFGDYNSEPIDSMTAYETTPSGTAVGTGFHAYPGNAYSYTYNTTTTQMPYHSDALARKIYIHLHRSDTGGTGHPECVYTHDI
jgi:hypothetical protein